MVWLRGKEKLVYLFIGDVTLAVVDSIKERCLQWICRERKAKKI